MRWQKKKNQNQNKTNKQNPKSSPIVLQEAWVSQAYCVTTDFQTLVNLPNSKTENKNQTAVENIKCEKTKHQIRGKNSMKSFITHLPLLVIFCIFGLHYKLPSVLHILCKAYLVSKEGRDTSTLWSLPSKYTSSISDLSWWTCWFVNPWGVSDKTSLIAVTRYVSFASQVSCTPRALVTLHISFQRQHDYSGIGIGRTKEQFPITTAVLFEPARFSST